MFAGHFGIAAAVKAKAQEVPLWALMVSTQLLDVFFVPLFLSGIETAEGSGYGGLMIHADYTHSLVGALLIAVLAGLAGAWLWGKRGGRIVGAVVFSHWLLDLLVHRADLPLMPGNYGGLPLLGFGIWESSPVSIVLESLLIVGGFALYLDSVLKAAKGKKFGLAITAAAIMGISLILSLVTDVMGL
jgi:membrane-bound metal-dependent hydrolase YbcI (DUF457 family)